MMRIIIKTLLIFFILLFSSLFLFDALVQFRDKDSVLLHFFKSRNIPVSLGYYTSHGRTLRHLATGNPDAPVTLLFLHGAPSSMSYFKTYFSNDTLLEKAYMLAVDRPGYGYSGFGDPVTSLHLQAQMIRPLIDSLHRQRHPLIVVGVSYGTSVACRLAMDYPQLVDGLVLIAPSLAPGEEKIYKIAYPIEMPFFKWAIPRMFISANAEKLTHKEELIKMLPHWKEIKVPVMYMQGENDGLLYPSNAAFAKRHLTNASFLSIEMIPHRGHLIMFSEKKKIKTAIIKLMDLSMQYYNQKQRPVLTHK